MAKSNVNVVSTLKSMTRAQKMTMLRDVIQNMAERNDCEEIAKFLDRQLGGDCLDVVHSYIGVR